MNYTYIKTKQTVIATDEKGNDTVLTIANLPSMKTSATAKITNAENYQAMIDGAIAFTTEPAPVTPTV